MAKQRFISNLTESQQAFSNLAQSVADAGYGSQTFKDVPTDKVLEALKKAGYSEVATDSGQITWVKPWWNTSGATSTATAGETMGQNLVSKITTEAGSGTGLVNITASSVGFTTEAASVTEGISMIAKTPKLAIVTAVASACGLAFGIDLGQELVDLYFGDDDFDWSTDSIGAKVLTYISGDKTYVDEDLANRIKDRLIDIGAFNDGSYEIKGLQVGTKQYFSGINFNYKPYENILLNAIEQYKNWRGNDDFLNTLIQIQASVKNKIISIEVYNVESWDISENDSISGCTRDMLNEILISNKGYNTINNNEISYYVNGYVKWKDDNKFFDRITVTDINATSGSSKIKIEHFQNSSSYNSQAIRIFGESIGLYNFTNLGKQVTGGISGVTKQDGATYPTKNTPLTTTYPDWGTNKGKVPTKDGEKTVLPLKIPKPNKGTEPQNEAQTGKYPETEPDPYIDDLITENKLPNNPENIPTKDDGDTPTPVIPPIGVEATGFVALYNPTQSQLSSFSQYLWSNDFIDNFKKLFANPMDAIIGLHMIYATPIRGDEAEIVCGYAHSGVVSNTVHSQYIEIDCGSIKVNRYFGSVLDYAPYTKLQVYLPFVGIVDLDTNEIMGGTLNIKYRIDVLTGSCLARLKVTRGDYKAELYNFAGNCAVQLPISGGSYSGIIANAIGVAGSIGATIATGGALAPVLVGSAVSSAINSHVNVSHSGSLGSNAGALGIMKPYLIITRPKPAEADNFNKFYGKPSNKTVRLSSCSGYTRVKDVHVDNIVATDNELSEIEQLLKEGVII